MIKVSLLILLSSLSLPSFAVEPLSADGLIFGVTPGTYVGSDVLNMVVKPKYKSTRILEGNRINAHTDANLGSFKMSVSAILQIQPTGNGRFNMYEVGVANPGSGSGFCDAEKCHFDIAGLNNGTLTLHETWKVTDTGFDIVEGSQTMEELGFIGIDASYVGKFHRQP